MDSRATSGLPGACALGPLRCGFIGDLKGQRTPELTWWVPGEPKGQPRPRAFARKIDGEYHARMYDPATAECWKGQIAAAVGKAPKPLDGPVFVHAELFFRRPQGLNRKKDPDGAIRHVKKPDADNCGKALLDCLTGLGWWHDDSQVCHLVVSKYYTEKNGAPGSRIVIKQLGVEL